MNSPLGLGRLSQRPVRDKPLMTETADRGDSLVVAVVVDQSNVCPHCRGGEQQIGWWHSAMVPSSSQGKLRHPRMSPETGRHRDSLKGRQATSYLLGAWLIGSKPGQLEDDQVANQDQARLDGGVEPLCEPGEAPVPNPGPNARIEECRSIELRKRQLCRGTQERSRPTATS